jgi:hypothetical protein
MQAENCSRKAVRATALLLVSLTVWSFIDVTGGAL